ncbi:hypothetical protein D3C59_13495 [Streptomyces sp. SHP22-7]|nr:hypothetical protein D3C59_13495 [Streptomyces sp. SHP22-7]
MRGFYDVVLSTTVTRGLMFETAKVTGTEPEAMVDGVDVLVSLDDTDQPPGSGDMGIFGRRGEDASVRRIPAAVLRENLQRTVDALQQVMGDLTVPEGGMRLQQAQVSFEITATGGSPSWGRRLKWEPKGRSR